MELAAYGYHLGGKRNRLTHVGEAASDIAAAIKQKPHLNNDFDSNNTRRCAESENDEPGAGYGLYNVMLCCSSIIQNGIISLNSLRILQAFSFQQRKTHGV